MSKLGYDRKGLGDDELTQEWFCDVLSNARQLMEGDNLDEAEFNVAVVSLFALERMNTNALTASLNVLAEILEARGITLQEYLDRGDMQSGGFRNAA